MKTIGEVIEILEKADGEENIYFDFCRFIPCDVDSWRGIYAEAALGYAELTYDKDPVTVAGLLSEIECAIEPNMEYEGWKGGRFKYNKDTPLHIDNQGECTNTEIEGISYNGYCYIIHTESTD